MKPITDILKTYPSKFLLLIILYIITGKLGLILAVPPGFATVIWPPSGLALGMLIMHGARLWPGLLIGSFLLNSYIGGAYTPETGIDGIKTLTAFMIAIGSTLQALLGLALVRRWLGLPLKLTLVREVLQLFFLTGPIACVIAATFGVASLYLSGVLPWSGLMANWFAWWAGDIFGILVFLPLMLVAPGSPHRIQWRGTELGTLPALSMLILLVPLGLIFYAWKITSTNEFEKEKFEFNSLVTENETALFNRIDTYETALLSGQAFYQNKNQITHLEWHNYVEKLRLNKSFPGVSSLGISVPVKTEELPTFVQNIRNDTHHDFIVHPDTANKPNYIVSYAEPLSSNSMALGLNMAFDDSRLRAAEQARDSGQSILSEPITPLDHENNSPSFLILHPMYQEGVPLNSTSERRNAFVGWIYATVLAQDLAKNLTPTPGELFNLKIYEGDREDDKSLIYKSNSSLKSNAKSDFIKRKKFVVMQQPWLLVWESTPYFEENRKSNESNLVLIGGLFFTGMFGLFVLAISARQSAAVKSMAGPNGTVVCSLVFILLSYGSYFLYQTLSMTETNYIKLLTEDEGNKIQLLLNSKTNEKINALILMARRWEMAEGTPYLLWQNDAQNYIQQLMGLRTIEWVDSTYHVRWAEPKDENKNAIGLDIVFNNERKHALEGAAEKKEATLTQPLHLVQGYEAFIAYLPLHVHEKFDGFIAAIFALQDFFAGMENEIGDNFSFAMDFNGHEYYSSDENSNVHNPEWAIDKTFPIYNQSWVLHIAPTDRFILSQKSPLPRFVLFAGLMIAALATLSLRFIFIARLKAVHLKELNKTVLDHAHKLAISEERYDLAVRGMSVGVWDRNIETGELYLSDKFYEILGIEDKTHKLVAQDFYNLLHPDDLEAVLKAVKNHIENKVPYSIEYRLRHSRGHYIWIHATGKAQWDESGKPLRIAGSINDISERKAVSSALWESNALKSAILSSTQSLIIATDRDGLIKVFNEAAEKALGYRASELIDKQSPAIWHDTDEIVRRAKILSKELSIPVSPGFDVFTKKAERFGADENEWTFIRSDGSRFPVSLTVTALRNEDNTITGYLGVIVDITKRKEIERIKNELVSVISHELRTPLTAIRGALSLLVGSLAKEIPDKANRLIEIANNNSEQLILLINDMLDIDKISSGQMRFNLQLEKLSSLILQSIENNQPYANKFGVSIRLAPVDETLLVKVDSGRFAQVMANLLSNAAKFSKSGDIIEVAVTCDGTHSMITVKDHGPGIAEEFRNRIFEKFSQADTSMTRPKGGTGLGLFISKQIIEKMGGHIGFDTKVGEGTTFRIKLPVALKKETSTETSWPVHEDSTVLICEDSQSVAEIMRMMMSDHDIKADIAPSLTAARDMMLRHKYAIITLDENLPDGKGLALALELRNDPITRQMPIIMVTGSDEDTRQDNRARIDAWLKKPVEEQLMINVLKKYLSRI